jgi:CIC family chloride channel protein
MLRKFPTAILKVSVLALAITVAAAGETIALKPLPLPGGASVVSLPEHLTLAEVRSRIAEGRPGSGYQGFPVLNDRGQLTGVVTRRDLLDPARMSTELVGALTIKNHAVIFDDNTLSEANELMVREGVGRLPVVDHDQQRKVIGIISRRDIMSASHRRIEQEDERQRGIRW